MKTDRKTSAAEWANEEKKRLTVFARYRMAVAPGLQTSRQWRETFRKHEVNARRVAERSSEASTNGELE